MEEKQYDTVVVVGHGASMIGSGLGAKIDAADAVVRFLKREGKPPEDWGERSDVLCTGTQDHSRVINEGVVPEIATWVYSKPGDIIPMDRSARVRYRDEWGVDYYDGVDEQMLLLRLHKYKPVICYELWPWYARYKALGATGYLNPNRNDGMPSFGQGVAGVISACVRLRPRRLILAGFDNTWAGSSENYLDWSAIQWGWGPRESGHDRRVEKILLGEIAEHYNVDIGPLNADAVC